MMYPLQLLDSLHVYKLLSLESTSARPNAGDAASVLGYAPLQAWMSAAQDLILSFEV